MSDSAWIQSTLDQHRLVVLARRENDNPWVLDKTIRVAQESLVEIEGTRVVGPENQPAFHVVGHSSTIRGSLNGWIQSREMGCCVLFGDTETAQYNRLEGVSMEALDGAGYGAILRSVDHQSAPCYFNSIVNVRARFLCTAVSLNERCNNNRVNNLDCSYITRHCVDAKGCLGLDVMSVSSHQSGAQESVLRLTGVSRSCFRNIMGEPGSGRWLDADRSSVRNIVDGYNECPQSPRYRGWPWNRVTWRWAR